MKTFEELKIIMDENEDLFDGLVESGEYRFRVWLKDNMKIYNHFVDFAITMRFPLLTMKAACELEQNQSGKKYYSARMIWERIRWETEIVEKRRVGGAVLKLNNNYAPFMARLVMVAEPELEGMFQKRGARQ